MAKYSVVGILLLLSTGCSEVKHAAGPEPAPAKSAPAPPAVVDTGDRVTLPPDAPQLTKLKIEAVQSQEVAIDEVTAAGNLETNPNRVGHATLPVPGRIASVFVKLGDAVKEGDPLLAVESPDVDAAELAYRQAEAGVAQSKAIEVKAQADLDRLTDLLAHQAVAQKEVLAAQNALTLAKVSVQQSEAARLQTARRMEILGLKPGNFGQKVTVRAPLTGKVLAVSVVAGEYRNDLSVPLATIADLRSLWVSSNVPEGYIRHCRIGGAVQVELVAFPGELFRGRVSHIADTVDSETRTVKVRAELDNSSGRFRPEMYGHIRYGEIKQALPVVPETAILQYDGKPAVFVEESPGNFVRRSVVADRRLGSMVVVREGLKRGERVVTSGAIYLKGGI